jgi:hypothetical protein
MSYWTTDEETGGIAAGCAGTGWGLAGGLGMYNAPVWPQPARTAAAPIISAMEGFTIRITV